MNFFIPGVYFKTALIFLLFFIFCLLVRYIYRVIKERVERRSEDKKDELEVEEYLKDYEINPIPEPPFAEDKKTIFIVDDSRGTVSMLVDLLKEEYNIFYEFDGESALKRLERVALPHLIISDVVMPVMDGLEFYRKLKDDRHLCALPFIFFSVQSDYNSRLKGLELGAVDYVDKTGSLIELKYKIKNMLAQRELHEELIKDRVKLGLDMGFEEFCAKQSITGRQYEVVNCFRKNPGLYNREVADMLNISPSTVDTYIKRFLTTMNLPPYKSAFKEFLRHFPVDELE